MELIKILKYLDKKFPEKGTADWDKSGLQNYDSNLSMNLNREIKNVFITLDLTVAAFDEAIKFKADLIISRHPFIFNDLKSEKNNLAKRAIIKNLIAQKIIIYSIHSNYDASVNNNLLNLIDEQMNIKKFQRFGENKEGFHIKLKNDLVKRNFFNQWKRIFPNQKFSLSDNWFKNGTIRDFYIISGSGGNTMINSQLTNAVVVTGDLKWNHWLYALDNDVRVLSVGHEMENHFSHHLSLLLKNAYPELNILAYTQISPFKILDEEN